MVSPMLEASARYGWDDDDYTKTTSNVTTRSVELTKLTVKMTLLMLMRLYGSIDSASVRR